MTVRLHTATGLSSFSVDASSSYDLLIAGQAKACGLVMVTNNITEFYSVERLVLEDWIDEASPT